MSVILPDSENAFSPPKIAILTCSVFEREIALLAHSAEHIAEERIFEMGLHDRPNQLRATLQANLDIVDARTDIEVIVLAYGLCGRGTAGLRPLHHKLVIPRVHDPEKSLAEIAYACGFCDQAYFSRVFQDIKGITPKLFRSANQPEHQNTKETHRNTRPHHRKLATFAQL